MKIEVHKEDKTGNVFTLLERLHVAWNGHEFDVPEGFESDGASVPRFFWRAVFPPGDSKALPGAIAHDYLYRTHPTGWSKGMSDAMFYEMLTGNGVPKIRAAAAWAGVHYFGKRSWEQGSRK